MVLPARCSHSMSVWVSMDRAWMSSFNSLARIPLIFLVTLDKGKVFKGRADDHQLEMGFRSRRHIVHVTFVDNVQTAWRQRGLDFLFDGLLDRHDSCSFGAGALSWAGRTLQM